MKKRFWSRHPWLRRCIHAGGALLFAAIIVLLYIAYVYMPPAYLRWMEQQHLDGYVRQALEGLFVQRKVTNDVVQEYYIPYTFHCNLISQWVLERNLDWRVTERLIPQMKTPTLVILGKQDNLLLPNLSLPRWHQLDSHAQIVVIDHAGHTVHDDQPEQVNQLILNFLAA
jgi:pimeloyl-ACP methyl ester carboxylesterase